MIGLEMLVKSMGLDPAMLAEIAERAVEILRSYQKDMAALHAENEALRVELAALRDLLLNDEDEDEDEDDGEE